MSMSDEEKPEDSTPQTPPEPEPPKNLEFKGGGDAIEKQVTAEDKGSKKQ
jgi:hypothetical protein